MKKQNKCKQNESFVTLLGVLYWAMERKRNETITRVGSFSSSEGRKVIYKMSILSVCCPIYSYTEPLD